MWPFKVSYFTLHMQLFLSCTVISKAPMLTNIPREGGWVVEDAWGPYSIPCTKAQNFPPGHKGRNTYYSFFLFVAWKLKWSKMPKWKCTNLFGPGILSPSPIVSSWVRWFLLLLEVPAKWGFKYNGTQKHICIVLSVYTWAFMGTVAEFIIIVPVTCPMRPTRSIVTK